jgi:hypothetical protein
MQVYVDILDFSSSLSIIRNSKKGHSFYYLITAEGLHGRLAIRFLKFAGRNPIQIKSYFKSFYRDLFKTYNNSAIDFLFNYVEPIWLSELEFLGNRPNDEKNRIARYASMSSWPYISRTFELVMLTQSLKEDIILLVQNSPLFPAIKNYSNKSNLKTLKYYAPFRRHVHVRSGYHYDQDVNFSLRYSVSSVLGALKSIFPGILSAIKRFFYRSHLIEDENFDIIAIAYQPKPSSGFNDLFWAENFRENSNRKVLGVYFSELSESCYNFYLSKVNRLESVNGYASSFLNFRNKKSPLAAGRYLVRVARMLLRLFFQLLRGKISFIFASFFISLNNAILFYSELMKMTGARYSWAMLEGNDLNSIALTIASGKNKGASFGATWSLWPLPQLIAGYARNNILFIWGEHHRNVFSDSKALPGHLINSGYPTGGIYLDNYNFDKSTYFNEIILNDLNKKIVTFYDNICRVDIHISCEALQNLYSSLLTWLENNQNIILIIKTKRETVFNLLKKETKEKIYKLEKNGALIIKEEKGDLSTGLASDLVIGISSSTLACLAASYGKRCILFNQYNMMIDDGPSMMLPSVTCIRTVEELSDAIDLSLSLPVDTKERGGYINSFTDEQNDMRIAYYMDSIMKKIEEGSSIESAIKVSELEYNSKYSALNY